MHIFHTPLLALHVEEAFGEDVVWAGLVLAINTVCVVISLPLWGLLMDRYKYNPYIMLLVSSLVLPLSYLFVGPAPFLGLHSSKLQLFLSLAAVGVAVPMAYVPAIPLMYNVYSIKYHGELPASVRNTLVSLFTGAFPVGAFLGLILSILIAPQLSFRWSTGSVALGYLVESVLCACYVWKTIGMKRKYCNEIKSVNPTVCIANPILQ